VRRSIPEQTPGFHARFREIANDRQSKRSAVKSKFKQITSVISGIKDRSDEEGTWGQG
jgi:hypothetical protein